MNALIKINDCVDSIINCFIANKNIGGRGMCVNEGDKVNVICKVSGYITGGIFINKTEDHYILFINGVIQMFSLHDWKIEV